MSLNKFMHPRNPYKVQPNFKEMAVKYPDFRKVVTQDLAGKIHLDFSNPVALRRLTETLFLKDFDLTICIPPKCLVPTLPSRMNYLLWVEDLLSLLAPSPEPRCGLDIGAGAAAVYPLLGLTHFKWRMTATEASEDNFEAATNNLRNNKLEKEIRLIKVDKSEIFMNVLRSCDNNFDFSMCNPPFYKHDKEFIEEEPAGSESEILTSGGEVEFVKKMINESCEHRTSVKIFTVLLGHKSSLSPVKQQLVSQGVPSLVTTEFCQGKTMRWGVAWTFQPDVSLKKVIGTKAKKDKQKPFSLTLDRPESLPKNDYTAQSFYQRIKGWLEEISVQITTKKDTKYLCAASLGAREKSWQNQRRAKREGKRKLTGEESENKEDCKVRKTSDLDCKGKFSEETEDSEPRYNSIEESLLREISSSDRNQTNNSVVQSKTQTCDGNDDDDAKLSPAYVLECDLIVRWSGDKVILDVAYLDGEAGRDGVHQICQFIKNKFSTLS